MTRLLSFPAAAFAALLLLSPFARADSVTQTRSVGSFQGISLKGSATLVVKPGSTENVQVRASEKAMPDIETRVIDVAGVATLEIDMKKRGNWGRGEPVTVTVELPTLKALALSGSGDATADGFKTGALKVHMKGAGDLKLRQLSADQLTVSISGSGSVETTGRAGRSEWSIAGSGDVKARSLESDDVSVSIAGSGDASLNARKTLNVSIAGSGDVEYTGDAQVKTSVAGSGNVSKH